MLKQIKYFQAVVRCNSFSEAAEECYISQSAISQQVQALERELGVTLLKRENRRLWGEQRLIQEVLVRRTECSKNNIFERIYCRIYQTFFRVALPVLPYREPERL